MQGADDAGSRRWRWGVWSAVDDEWQAELQRRHTRQLRRYQQVSLSVAAPPPTTVKIPKIIHHIWLGPNTLPPRCAEWMESWRKWHPTWEHRTWRDEDVSGLKLINQKAYEEASNYGEKSDILRYEILKRHGGVYVDVDVQCLQRFDDLIESFSFVVGISNTGCVEISNAIVASAPGHPIVNRLIEKIHKRANQPRLDTAMLARIAQLGGANVAQHLNLGTPSTATPMSTIERTGPGLMTRTFMEAVGWIGQPMSNPGSLTDGEQENAIALPIEFFFSLANDETDKCKQEAMTFPPQALAVHFWQCSWMTSYCVNRFND